LLPLFMMRHRVQKDMIDPIDAAEQTEKAEAKDPIEPIESAEPIDPIDSTEPLEAIDRNESWDQSDHLEVPGGSSTSCRFFHPSSKVFMIRQHTAHRPAHKRWRMPVLRHQGAWLKTEAASATGQAVRHALNLPSTGPN
jgi:hypothetical protein